MKITIAVCVLALCCCGCDQMKQSIQPKATQEGRKEMPLRPFQRFVPVGTNPEIALDTVMGKLCRTVPNGGDPLGILDPGCGVTKEMKDIGFVPKKCSSGKTWVKSESKSSAPYSNVPDCDPVVLRWNPETQ